MRDFNTFAKLDDTVAKFNAVAAKEPELRKRYLAAMETLRVTLPPEEAPATPTESFARMTRRIHEGAAAFAAAIQRWEAAVDAGGMDRRVWEKTKIGARRELRAINNEVATDLEMLLWTFYDDAIQLMHHLKRLAKIENNPNGYYTEQYRRVCKAYHKTQRALSSPKMRKVVAASRANGASRGGGVD